MATIQGTSVPLRAPFHFFILDSCIPFITQRWSNECLGSIERESKQEGGKVKKTKRRERGKGKRIVES